MSLNWKEIDCILAELALPGAQIQKAIQSAFDVVCLRLYGQGKTTALLIALTPGACRLHRTFQAVPKNDRPLRFAEFLNARIVNGWIEAAEQLGDNRIVRIQVRRGEERFRVYLRLWSNAANVIVTTEDGTILDAMRRLPKRGEVTGGHYAPEAAFSGSPAAGPGPVPGAPCPVNAESAPCPASHKTYEIRTLPGAGSFNERVDAWYAEHGGALSLEALREQARTAFEGRIGRIGASLERLRAKEAEYAGADQLKEYGDLILANLNTIVPGAPWLETLNWYTNEPVRIRLDPRKEPAAQAESYYQQYRKAKHGLADIQAQIAEETAAFTRLEDTLTRLLAETNPLILHKLLRHGGSSAGASAVRLRADQKRPGLTFRRGNWLIIVGRDSKENDDLLRHHVKGGDLWLHAREYAGSYVFIKYRSGKTYPLDILLDGGNLAVFYSKGRNNGAGDVFYTPVKFLRRAKDGPRGLVIPTQEKNLHITLDPQRLSALEACRVEKGAGGKKGGTGV